MLSLPWAPELGAGAACEVPGGHSSWGVWAEICRKAADSLLGGPCGQHGPVPLLREPGQRPAFPKPQHAPSPPPEQRCRFSVEPVSGEEGHRDGASHSLFHSQVLGPGPAASGVQWETTEPGPALVELPLWWG